MAVKPARLTIKQILAWADEHAKRYRRWPQSKSGAVPGKAGRTGMTWRKIDDALNFGIRGLPGGSSHVSQSSYRRMKSQPRS